MGTPQQGTDSARGGAAWLSWYRRPSLAPAKHAAQRPCRRGRVGYALVEAGLRLLATSPQPAGPPGRPGA